MVRFEVIELMILITSGVKIRNTSFKCEYLEKTDALLGKILLPEALELSLYSRCVAAESVTSFSKKNLVAQDTIVLNIS